MDEHNHVTLARDHATLATKSDGKWTQIIKIKVSYKHDGAPPPSRLLDIMVPIIPIVPRIKQATNSAKP